MLEVQAKGGREGSSCVSFLGEGAVALDCGGDEVVPGSTGFHCPGKRAHSDQPPSWTIPLPPRHVGSQVLLLRPPPPLPPSCTLHPPDEEGGLHSTHPPCLRLGPVLT